MDVGRVPVARFPSGDVKLAAHEVTFNDLEAAVSKVRQPLPKLLFVPLLPAPVFCAASGMVT